MEGVLVRLCIEAATESADAIEKWRRQRPTLERMPSNLVDALLRNLLRRRLLFPSLLEYDLKVHPSDVLGPSVPGLIVLLIDCPTLFHFEDLLSQQCLAPYYLDTAFDIPKGSKLVNCVIHLNPPFIAHIDDYQKWMLKFGAAQHVMAGHEMKNIELPILKASARIAACLNCLCPQFFPSPGFWSLQNLTSLPSESHKVLLKE